ncbi:MAG: inner rane transporter permease protein YddR [Deltaproteobacteria bacterium]|jgi:ABC-type dipeptide/oligopeptide/nickel transport system permease component|nr:inner rane transporter permease protein YddR [Deltaproteobacteria bacterium]
MKGYILKRLFHSIFVLVGISLVVFIILHLTGDPAALLMPMDATPEQVAQFRKEMGFTDPIIVQYWRFFKGTLRGDFGQSFRHSQPALDLVMERMPATVQLTAAAMVIALAVAIPVGIISAIRRNSILDHIGMTGALLGQSTPVFWLGIMLILIFSVTIQWFPSSGRGEIQHLVLPAITLGMFTMARTARMMRSSMLEVMGQEYMKTAKAKGLSPGIVILKHALKNAAIPVVTIIGMELGTLLGGAVITETIFAWPGVGRLAVQAIYNRDYPVVQAAVFILASIFVLVNLIVDLLYTYLDPRVKLA